nr:hypothetical protein [uncultured Campylobacter sp.]
MLPIVNPPPPPIIPQLFCVRWFACIRLVLHAIAAGVGASH